MGFKDDKEPLRSESFLAKNRYSRNIRSSISKNNEDPDTFSYYKALGKGKTLPSLNEKQMKALIKMQAFSRGNSARNTKASWSTRSFTNEESLDLPKQQQSYSKDYVDKLKAELASKSEDNEKLRNLTLSEPSPATTAKARTGFMGIFRMSAKPSTGSSGEASPRRSD